MLLTVLTFAKWIAEAPEWILALPEGLQRFCFQVFQVFIFENRWRFFTDGLATTFIVTIGALIIGVIIGSIFGIITAFSSTLNTLFKPFLTAVKTTPVVSFIILALIWLDKVSVPIFITMLMVMPVVWANVTSSIVNTD